MDNSGKIDITPLGISKEKLQGTDLSVLKRLWLTLFNKFRMPAADEVAEVFKQKKRKN